MSLIESKHETIFLTGEFKNSWKIILIETKGLLRHKRKLSCCMCFLLHGQYVGTYLNDNCEFINELLKNGGDQILHRHLPSKYE